MYVYNTIKTNCSIPLGKVGVEKNERIKTIGFRNKSTTENLRPSLR